MHEAGSLGKPLRGKRIVVTRPIAQAQALRRALQGLGAEVLVMPTIRIADPSDPEPLREAARAPRRFDWIIFTSANAVARFWAAMRELGVDERALTGVSVCAVGSATAAAVEREGGTVALVPPEYVAESIAEALAAHGDLAGKRVLLPRADGAREVLPEQLRRLGAEVVDVVAYETVSDSTAAGSLRKEIESGSVDLVTFTSSSTARHFAELVTRDLGSTVVASIGPITSATVRELGWDVAVEPAVHTAAALTAAIAEYYSGPAAAVRP